MDINRLKKQLVLEDGHLLCEKPLCIVKYGKTFTLKPVNWFYDWKPFTSALGKFLGYHHAIVGNMTLPDAENGLKNMSEFIETIKQTVSNKYAWRQLVKICKFSYMPMRFMKKHFTLDDWVEIFLYVFFFNAVAISSGLHNALKAVRAYQV